MAPVRDVVRLTGTDDDVLAVARAAATVIAPQRDLRRALGRELAHLHQGRREITSAASTRDQTQASPSVHVSTIGHRVWVATWCSLLSIGWVGSLLAIIGFGTPTSKNRFTDPDEAIAMATAGVLVSLVLALLLVLPIPRGQASLAGTVVMATTAVLCATQVIYRLVVQDGDSRGFTADQVADWAPYAIGVLAVQLLLAARCNLVRRRQKIPFGPSLSEPGTPPSRREQARHLRTTAHRLAATPSQLSAAATADWGRQLDRLEQRGVHQDTIAQARTMAPHAWLVWVFYDGDLAVTDLLADASRRHG